MKKEGECGGHSRGHRNHQKLVDARKDPPWRPQRKHRALPG